MNAETTELIEQPTIPNVVIPKTHFESIWILLFAILPTITWIVKEVVKTKLELKLKEQEAKSKEDEEEKERLNLLISQLIESNDACNALLKKQS